MSKLIKLEKRFENALEKLEVALSNKNASEASKSINKRDKGVKKNYHNVDDLLIKIENLEQAAKNDAEEINKLVGELKEIIENDND